MEKIFIAIASFRDYELPHTILDLISKAENPQRLVFSVVHQFDEEPETNENCINHLLGKYPIHLELHHWTESRGGCWARNIAQKYYANERYALQIDSHTRVIKHWDSVLIRNIENLRNISPKPIISYLSPSYSRNDEYGIDYLFSNIFDMDKIQIPKIKNITSQYWIEYGGYENEQRTGYKNVRVPVLYGGFIFSDGQWVVEVEQDPLHYYTGEEFALAVRSYTKGYDIYTPDRIVSWHRAHNEPNKKHFTVLPPEFGQYRHKVAMERLRRLFEGGDLGKYGLGTHRTLDEYEQFSGIDFKNKQIKTL
jgi:hypothetical protein